MGRTFRPDENARTPPRRDHRHDLWQHPLRRRPAVVGKGMTLDGVTHEIIGVMPRILVPSGPSLWTPLEYTED